MSFHQLRLPHPVALNLKKWNLLFNVSTVPAGRDDGKKAGKVVKEVLVLGWMELDQNGVSDLSNPHFLTTLASPCHSILFLIIKRTLAPGSTSLRRHPDQSNDPRKQWLVEKMGAYPSKSTSNLGQSPRSQLLSLSLSFLICPTGIILALCPSQGCCGECSVNLNAL